MKKITCQELRPHYSGAILTKYIVVYKDCVMDW